MDGETDRRTVCAHRSAAGETGGSAWAPPPCQPSPRRQHCTVTAPRRPRTRALAQQTAPATQPTRTGGTAPRHDPPPPPSFPQLARRSCKVRVQKALPAHSIPGATSPLRELGLLGRRELLPGDMAVGKGTVGAMGQHPSQGDRHSPLQAPWDPQHHPTGAPTPPVPIDSHTIPLIPTKACTFLLC